VRPCPGISGFSCGSLSVRLDPFGPAPGRLSLRVALSDAAADLEALRQALGAPRLALDGVSYGSYVAERFALAHPDQVNRLVLDSVVPAWNVDPLQADTMRRIAAVLRDACAAQGCAADPAADLAVVVRRYHDGPDLLDTLVALSIGAPSFPGVPAALHAAAAGRPAALARAVARLSTAQVWPFDRATAAGNGIIQTCLYWPATPTPSPGPAGAGPRAELPRVPVLLLAGSHDLSTPLSGAQAQAARAPDGRLFVVPGAGHSVQSRAPGDAAQAEVARFLA
jgi:pimeloyl-ACP methyl ester carboxylesterase